MPALPRFAILASATAPTSTTVAVTVTLPAYLEVIVDVYNRHTTAASLSTVTLAGTGGETYSQRATTTDGGGSPTHRLTRFRCMVAANTATTMTATAANAIAQTEFYIRVTWVSGVNPAGTNGAGGEIQTVLANSAGANVTGLTPSISMTAGNAALATFASGIGSPMAPRSGWTEIADVTVTAGSQVETQERANVDTAYGATGGSGTWMGMFTELTPVPGNRPTVTPVVAVTGNIVSLGGTSLDLGSATFKPGCAYYAMLSWGGGASAPTGFTLSIVKPNGDAATNPSATQILFASAVSAASWAQAGWRIVLSGSIPVTVSLSVTVAGLTGGSASAQVFEAASIDTTQGVSGELSGATESSSVSNLVGVTTAFTRRDSFALLCAGSKVGAVTADPGWILVNTNSFNAISQVTALVRETAPSPATVTTGTFAGHASFVVELAPFVAYSPPVITLISPANGSTIANTASITIDMTDVDGDLSAEQIFAGGARAYYAGAIQTGFTVSSTKTPVTGPDGFRFVLTPDVAWASGALHVIADAADALGATALAIFDFTVTAPVVNDPIVALVSPTGGSSIANTASITVDVTDPDGDLSSVTIEANGTNVYTSGAFQTGFTSSSKTTITNGFRFVLTPTGTWGTGALGIYVDAVDSRSVHVTPTFYFTVLAPSVHAPVIALLSPSSPGPIGQFESVVIQITDADNDLDVASIAATANAETAYTASAFGSGYTSSTQITITHGIQLTFRRGIGWSGGTLSLFLTASDTGGRTTPAFFSWSPVTSPGIPTLDDVSVPAAALGDVRVQWADGTMDMTIVSDDVGFDAGLRTAVLLSLFTDRRAEDDDTLPAEDGDRRGWWGDEFSAVEGDKIGSRLWLLDRSALRSDVAQRAEEYIREALAWMIEDRVVQSLGVEVEVTGEQLSYAVVLNRPQGDAVTFRFAHVWTAVASEAS